MMMKKMPKDTAIRILKAKNAKLFNPDFNFEREFNDLLLFEDWCIDEGILTPAEIDECEK